MFDFLSASAIATHSMISDFRALRILPDTVVTITIPAEPGFFDRVGTIASFMLALAVLLLAVGLVAAAWHLRGAYLKLNALLDRLSAESKPLLQSASAVTDDVRDITSSVKRNVLAVEETIATANSELLGAVRNTERKIEQFNALLGAVQDEAASAFISTASTVRGVGTGLAAAFGSSDSAEDDLEEDAEGYYDDFEYEGDEGEEPHAAVPRSRNRLTGGPRVRPKRGTIDEE